MSWTLFLLDIISPVVIKYKNFKIDLSVLLKWLIQIKLIIYGGHELVEWVSESRSVVSDSLQPHEL